MDRLIVFCLVLPWLCTSLEGQEWKDSLGKGEYEKAYRLALPEYERVLAMAGSASSSDFAKVEQIMVMSRIMLENGDFSKGERILSTRLKYARKSANGNTSEAGTILSDLAENYERSGQFEKAIQAREESAEFTRPNLSRIDNLRVNLNTRAEIANLHARLGNRTRAVEDLSEVVKEQEDSSELKSERDYLVARLGYILNLAENEAELGQLEAASASVDRAIDIIENPERHGKAATVEHAKLVWGSTFPYDASRIGKVLLIMGKNDKAADFLRQGLAHLDSISQDVPTAYRRGLDIYRFVLLGELGRSYLVSGEYSEATEAFSEQSGLLDWIAKSNPIRVRELESYALAAHISGGPRARELLRSATDLRKRFSEIRIGFGSLRQRLEYMSNADAWSLPAAFGDANAVLEAVLQFKGVGFDSVVEESRLARSGNPAYAELLEKRRALMDATLASGPTDKLQKEVSALEDRIARDFAGSGRTREAFQRDTADLLSALPEGAVLCEYLRYIHYAKDELPRPHYGALVVAAGRQPAWFDLGDVDLIDAEVRTCRAAIEEQADDETLEASLRKLHGILIEPLAEHLTEETLILAPDGALSFLPFAVLLDAEGRFLAETKQLRFVSTASDLLREGTQLNPSPSALIVANPDFSLTSGSSGSDTNPDTHETYLSRNSRLLEGVIFAPLPGTALESEKLQEILVEVTLLEEADATESQIRNALEVGAPDILHIATHGYYLPEGRSAFAFGESSLYPRMGPSPLGENGTNYHGDKEVGNPLYQCGLALAGAQATIDSWAGGSYPPSNGDGILLADEIGSLDLAGTKLVVLSACETALGEAVAGEGVFGIRRAFAAAGAERLLMTLWPIADEETVAIMEDFYRELEAGREPGAAFAEVQRKWLAVHRETGLWNAVYFAGPFVLSSGVQ